MHLSRLALSRSLTAPERRRAWRRRRWSAALQYAAAITAVALVVAVSGLFHGP